MPTYIGVRSLPLLRSRCKNLPPPMPDDLCMFKCRVMPKDKGITRRKGRERQ
jgi:hypothetical protein